MTTLNYKKIQIGNDSEASVQDIIVLHGVGADENSLIPFIKHLNVPGNYFFIQSRLPMGASGHTWFEVKFTANGPVHNKEQALESLEILHQWILDQKKSGVLKANAKLCFMGFSQGAIMSYAMAMGHPDSVDKVIGLNGRVLKEVEAMKPTNAQRRIAIYAFYGLYDQVQPLHFAHEAKKRLDLDWVDLNYHEGECAHEITEESARFTKEALLK